MTRQRGAAAAGIDHLRSFLEAAERFAVAVASADLRAPVPGCPSWSAYDVVCHLGNVHAWAATIVETGAWAAEQNDEPPTRRPRAVSDWYVGKAGDLHAVLRAADPEAACWNFVHGAQGRTSFWTRRQLHETNVHLLDLVGGSATRAGVDLDPEVCADGVDEVLRVLLHRMHHRGQPARLTAPLCLVATDTGRAWTVTPRVGAPNGAGVPVQPRGSAAETAPAIVTGPPSVAGRRHPTADRIEAPAETLLRLLWHRLSLDDVRLVGEEGAAEEPAGLSLLDDAPLVHVTGDSSRVRGFLASRLTP